MNIEIRNCNNIDSASINIEESKLNIKLASNGTGKSTIAKAIQGFSSNSEEKIELLLPFKYRDSNPEGREPELNGIDQDIEVMCFNEEYIKQFNFQSDELIANSFDILIKNDDYKEIEKDIENLVSETRKVFNNNSELESLILTLKELGDAFKLTNTGVSRASKGMKGLIDGNKLEHIPEGLELYKPFIQSDDSVSWIAWQAKGSDFKDLSESCPFCTSDIEHKKSVIEKVSEEYDKNNIKNLIAIIKIIDKLGEYFSAKAKDRLEKITKLKDGLQQEHESYIVNIKKQIDALIIRLENIRDLSGFQFEKDDKVVDKLKSYVIEMEFFSELNSNKMTTAIAPINEAIAKIKEKSGLLQGKINIQRERIEIIIENHQKNINDFLEYAGYKYKVEISGKNDQSKLKLMHVDYDGHLDRGDQYLSFGERNAFSLVLFMYECLSKKPDIIILDDPISSFDKNKKFAILEALFLRDKYCSFKNETVLMLTHDVEPIIDTIKSLRRKFNCMTNAAFLDLNDGVIVEKSIKRSDIKTFPEICKTVLESEDDEIIKIIYLRRYFEVIDRNSNEYQIISNLLHKRSELIDTRKKVNCEYEIMLDEDKTKGIEGIENHINEFNYESVLDKLNSEEKILELYDSRENRYEKLQLFRLLDVENTETNSVIQKFINETYHIENEYICQLSPLEFDTIPEYVIYECDEIICKEYEEKNS